MPYLRAEYGPLRLTCDRLAQETLKADAVHVLTRGSSELRLTDSVWHLHVRCLHSAQCLAMRVQAEIPEGGFGLQKRGLAHTLLLRICPFPLSCTGGAG